MKGDPDDSTLDVLLVAYTPPTGAVAELFAALAGNLSSIARVGVLAPESLHFETVAPIVDIRFPYATSRPHRAVVGAGWAAHRRAAALRPKTVLLFTQHPLNVFALAHLRSARILFWWHEPAARGQVSRLRALTYRAHDAVIAPRSAAIVVAAPSVAADVPARYQAKTSVVPFPAIPDFAHDSGKFTGSPTDLVFFGKLAPYKGLDTLAAALGQLGLAGRHPSLRIVGSGSLREAAPEMAQFASEHPDQVEHVDEYVPAADVSSAIRSATAVVLPYLTAAGSSTLAIAGTLDTPIITTRVGCFSDYLVDGVSGLLVEPDDSSQLAAAISRALDDDPGRRRLAAGARQLVTEAFDPQATARQLLDVIESAQR